MFFFSLKQLSIPQFNKKKKNWKKSATKVSFFSPNRRINFKYTYKVGKLVEGFGIG